MERGGDGEEVHGQFLDELRHEYRRRRSRPGVVMSGAGFAREVIRQLGFAREAAKLSKERVEWLGTAISRVDDQLTRVQAKRVGLVEEREAEKEALDKLEEKVLLMERMVGDTDEGLKMELGEICSCRSGCKCVQEVLVKVVTRQGELRTIKLSPEQLTDLGEEEVVRDWTEEVTDQESVVRTRTVRNVEERTETTVVDRNMGVSVRPRERMVNRQRREATDNVGRVVNRERELDRHRREVNGKVEQVNRSSPSSPQVRRRTGGNVEQIVDRASPPDRSGSGGVQHGGEEVVATDVELRGAEGSNRLKMVESFELMQRYARASLWTDVEATAQQVAIAWRAFTKRGGEGTVDKMLVRTRFESRCVIQLMWKVHNILCLGCSWGEPWWRWGSGAPW